MIEEENELHDERVAIVMEGSYCSYALAQKIANDEIVKLQKSRKNNEKHTHCIL